MAGALLTPASLAVLTATFSGAARGAAIGQWTAWSGISFVDRPDPRRLADRQLELARDLPHQRPDRDRAPSHSSSGRGWRVPAAEGRPRRRRRRAPRRRRPRPARRRLHRAAAARLGRRRSSWAGSPAAPLLAAFVVYELHTPTPMLPLRLFRLRNFCVTNIETLRRLRRTVRPGASSSCSSSSVPRYSPFACGIATPPDDRHVFPVFTLRALAMQRGPRLFMGVGPVIAGGVLAYTPARESRLLGRSPPRSARLRRRALADGGAADDDRTRTRAPTMRASRRE